MKRFGILIFALLFLALCVGHSAAQSIDGCQLSSNPYAANSTSNPYGRCGSRYSADSINNPYGQYGSPYSPNSVNNPYATQAPRITASDGTDLGRLSSNPYQSDSTSNRYGSHGSPYAPNSANNPYTYGSPYRSDGARNPYATIAPLLSDAEEYPSASVVSITPMTASDTLPAGFADKLEGVIVFSAPASATQEASRQRAIAPITQTWVTEIDAALGLDRPLVSNDWTSVMTLKTRILAYRDNTGNLPSLALILQWTKPLEQDLSSRAPARSESGK